jgi:hypothetical protein
VLSDCCRATRHCGSESNTNIIFNYNINNWVQGYGRKWGRRYRGEAGEGGGGELKATFAIHGLLKATTKMVFLKKS